MLFNSIDFAFFLPVVFALYWLAGKRLKLQNFVLLAASYYFYSCWDWRFLFLLVFSTLLDFYTGIRISDAKSTQAQKRWLWLSIGINLGLLGVFKYYNFFIENFGHAVSFFGMKFNAWSLKIVLPVGISFYTFHGLSYLIDIYRDRIKPERNFVDYAVFVSFFPLLIAGPIERATHLLPQINKQRNFSYTMAVDGMRQILWGLFKKLVIADNCAIYADLIFDHTGDYSGSTLVIGAVFFAFQIYGDFSGYSDIALGTARLFGIELLHNFAFPYFSRDIAEFWRRWHISLTSWFRDYVYIPLGGSRGKTWMKVRNTFIIFLISGFWHGANWTFIVWGGLNAVYFLPLLINKTHRDHLNIVAQGKLLPSIREFLAMAMTFGLVTFAWIFFRSDSLEGAFLFIKRVFTKSLFSLPEIRPTSLLLLILAFMIIEWLGRERRYAIASIGLSWWRPFRWSFYFLLLFGMLYFAKNNEQFIYFQF